MTTAQRKAKARTTDSSAFADKLYTKQPIGGPHLSSMGIDPKVFFWVTITSAMLSGRGGAVRAKSDPPCLSHTAFCLEYHPHAETTLSTEGWAV